jgi:hypothetical protein
LAESIPLTLGVSDATYAIVEPARRAGVTWDRAAVDAVIAATGGHPAHLQVYAYEAWAAASGPNITADVAAEAVARGRAVVEVQTLRPRWEAMTNRQIEFVTALAVLGGEARVLDLAAALGRLTKELSPARDALVKRGDVLVPKRGRLALAVPAMAAFAIANYEQARKDSAVSLVPQSKLMASRP